MATRSYLKLICFQSVLSYGPLYTLLRARLCGLGAPRHQGTVDEGYGFVQFRTGEFESWRANSRAAPADLFLNQLDKLDEFWHGVEPQERQKPLVKIARLFPLAVHRIMKKIDRLA